MALSNNIHFDKLISDAAVGSKQTQYFEINEATAWIYNEGWYAQHDAAVGSRPLVGADSAMPTQCLNWECIPEPDYSQANYSRRENLPDNLKEMRRRCFWARATRVQLLAV